MSLDAFENFLKPGARVVGILNDGAVSETLVRDPGPNAEPAPIRVPAFENKY
jgi:hypothetical protein